MEKSSFLILASYVNINKILSYKLSSLSLTVFVLRGVSHFVDDDNAEFDLYSFPAPFVQAKASPYRSICRFHITFTDISTVQQMPQKLVVADRRYELYYYKLFLSLWVRSVVVKRVI